MPIPPLLAAGLAVKGLTSVAQGVLGIGQKAEADRLAKTPFVPYEIEEEYYDNQGLAANLAQSGFTQKALDFYGGQADRGLATSTDAALRGGAGVNSFSKLYDTYLDNNMKIAAEDSQLQTQNIKLLMDRNIDLAGQKTQQWAINDYARWKDAQQAAAKADDAGNKNLFGAATGIASGFATAASAVANDNLANPPGSNSGTTAVAPPVNYSITPTVAATPGSPYDELGGGGADNPQPEFDMQKTIDRLLKFRRIL